MKLEKKNEFYGDFSCFLAIKSLGSDGNPRKPVHMMRLVPSYLQIGSDFVALSGKKSYEFFKIEKSSKLTFWNFIKFLKACQLVSKWLYRVIEVIRYRSRQKMNKKNSKISEKMYFIVIFHIFWRPNKRSNYKSDTTERLFRPKSS